jgi:hypothetical protein
VPTYYLDIAGIATAGEAATYAARSIVNVRPGTSISVTFCSFASSNPERFYIDILDKSSDMSLSGTKYSGRFCLDKNFPFDVIFPSRFSRMSADAVRDLISYDPNKNILTANLAAIYSRGFFDFDLLLRMSDPAVYPLKVSEKKPILRVAANKIAESHFTSVSVRVERPSNPDMHRLVISEDERVEVLGLYDIETGAAGGCDDRPYSMKTDGFVIRSAAGVQSLSEISFDGSYTVPANFPLFYVNDHYKPEIFRSIVDYPGANPKIHSSIRHISYNFANSVYFYDQVVTRKLQGGRGYAGNHPLVHIDDIFRGIVPHSDQKPVAEFRREYVPGELSSEQERSRRDANFFFYLSPHTMQASSGAAPIMSLRLRRGVPKDITCTLKWSLNGRKLIKNREEIKIECTTEWGETSGAKKKRVRTLHIKRHVADGHPWCKYTTYGSGDANQAGGYPLKALTVKDFFDILKMNVCGTIDGFNPNGNGEGGLFPTFADIDQKNVNPDDSIVEISTNKNYLGCYLLPAHRLTFGEELLAVGGEVNQISFTHKSVEIMCKGLEKDVSMSNLCCLMPLNRKLDSAGVRGAIKTFSQHLADGDFDVAGKAYSRFYMDWTMRSALHILREGRDYFAVTTLRPDDQVQTSYGHSPPHDRREAGKRAILVGAAHLGISVAILDEDYIGGGQFSSSAPSYLMSRIVPGEPRSAPSQSARSKVYSVDADGLTLMYMDSPMFRTVKTSLLNSVVETSVDLEAYPHGREGSIWQVVYTSGAGDGIPSSPHLDASYVSGSPNLLDPRLHGSEFGIMAEGGVLEESLRKISVHPCFDLPKDLAPDASMILKDLLDFGSATKRSSGNYAKVSYEESPTPCAVSGMGRKHASAKYYMKSSMSSPKSSYQNNEHVSFGMKFGDFEDAVWADFGFLSKLLPFSIVSRVETMPWMELDFYKYHIDTGSEDIDDPYLDTSSEDIDGPNLGIYEPYAYPIDTYSVEVLTPGNTGLRGYAFIDKNPRSGLKVKWRKRILEPRTFSFYLRNRQLRSLADLRDDINRRVGRYGIHATSLVKNPELRDQRTLSEREKTNIFRIVDLSSTGVVEDPYFARYRATNSGNDPYFIGDPYIGSTPADSRSIKNPADLVGEMDLTDVTPDASGSVVVHLRPFGAVREQLQVVEPVSSRTTIRDPAISVSPPSGWMWSQSIVDGVIGRVLQRTSSESTTVPVLPYLGGIWTWTQLNTNVWVPRTSNGMVAYPEPHPQQSNSSSINVSSVGSSSSRFSSSSSSEIGFHSSTPSAGA